MVRFFTYASLVTGFIITSLLGGCGEDKNKSSQNAANGKAVPQTEKIIVQYPGLENIMQGIEVKSLKSAPATLKIVSGETGLTLEDISAEKPGWVMWKSRDIMAGKTYTLNLEVMKGNGKDPLTQIQLKFKNGKKNLAQYYYLLNKGTSTIIPQKQATKSLASVSDIDGERWVFKLQGKAPDGASSMQIMLLPAVGRKNAMGNIVVKSINMTAE